MTRTAEAGQRRATGVIKLSGNQTDSGPGGDPDAPDGVSDAVTDTVAPPPAVEYDEPVPPTAGSAAPGSGFGRPRWWAIGIGAGLLALAAIYLVDLLLTSGEIERGTTIAGVDVGGLTPDEATAALNAQVLPLYGRPVTVDVHGEPTSLDPVNAGLTPDVAGSVAAVGERSANPITLLTSFFRSDDSPLAVRIDQAALAASLSAVAQQTALAPVEGSVTIEGTTVRSVAPVIGRDLQVPEAVSAVAAAWEAGGPEVLEGLVLPVSSSPVRASAEKTQAATQEATAILSAPLALDAAGTPVEVPVTAIAAATTIVPDPADGFTVAVDVPALRSPVTAALQATEAVPANAWIAIVNDAPVVNPAVPGRSVDWAATDAAIQASLRSPARSVPVSYTVTPPSLTTEQAQALGIKEVIGEFTTGGFASASGVNIRVVAEKVNGAIVQPRATFGLNEFTGTRGVEQGYVPAAIIQEGALSTAVGGGISQFATTLYNAAYFAGMGDVTHTPHSFYISRYPAGREATVFDGEIELAFSNDYDTGVLIQTIWTESDITVRLWGTKHVDVESISGDRFDFSSPQVVVKPYGQSCTPSGGSQGFSIVNTRVIRDLAGAEIRREDFTTVYNGQQNVVCTPAPTPAATPPATAPAAATTAATTPGG
jgi:vancomycin resistance protein YoaR